MKPLERRTHRVTFRSEVVVFLAMRWLALLSNVRTPPGACCPRDAVFFLKPTGAPLTVPAE
jgi:hypothetical protein